MLCLFLHGKQIHVVVQSAINHRCFRSIGLRRLLPSEQFAGRREANEIVMVAEQRTVGKGQRLQCHAEEQLRGDVINRCALCHLPFQGLPKQFQHVGGEILIIEKVGPRDVERIHLAFSKERFQERVLLVFLNDEGGIFAPVCLGDEIREVNQHLSRCQRLLNALIVGLHKRGHVAPTLAARC